MQDAIAKNPKATWKIVLMHHSIYSSANHETDADIIQRRADLPQVIDSLGIDVVLDGHDHEYTRSYQMKGGKAQSVNLDNQGRVVDPAGTLYMTVNSASGSKYYQLQEPNNNNYYEAKKEQLQVPTFSRVSVTSNDFTITTYRADTMKITDTYTIVKSSAPEQAAVDVNNQINNLPNADSVSLSDADKVQAARNAYNALDASQQKYITNLDKLTADESKIADLKAQAQKEDDAQAAAKVVSAINNIPSNISLDSNSAVSSAEAAYNALTPSQKSLVTNYDKLKSAQATVQQLNSKSNSSGTTPSKNSSSTTSSGTSNTSGNSASTSGNSTTTSTPDSIVETTANPKTGQFLAHSIAIALVLLLMSAGSVIILIRKKNMNLREVYLKVIRSVKQHLNNI